MYHPLIINDNDGVVTAGEKRLSKKQKIAIAASVSVSIATITFFILYFLGLNKHGNSTVGPVATRSNTDEYSSTISFGRTASLRSPTRERTETDLLAITGTSYTATKKRTVSEEQSISPSKKVTETQESSVTETAGNPTVTVWLAGMMTNLTGNFTFLPRTWLTQRKLPCGESDGSLNYTYGELAKFFSTTEQEVPKKAAEFMRQADVVCQEVGLCTSGKSAETNVETITFPDPGKRDTNITYTSQTVIGCP